MNWALLYLLEGTLKTVGEHITTALFLNGPVVCLILTHITIITYCS